MMTTEELGEEYDEFRTTTGLKDDYDGIVTDAYFGKPQSGGDRLMMFLKISADDGDEVENRYGLGNGWETYDGGKTVEHPTDRYFNNRTAWAEFFTAAINSGAKEELGRRSAKLERRGPRDSRLLIGMKFHFLVKTETMNLPKRDEMGQPVRDERGQIVTQAIDVNRVLPTKYLGTAEDQPTPKAGTSRRSSKSSSTEAAPSGSESSSSPSSNGSGDKVILAKLKVLAKTNSFEEWVDKAMDTPGVLDDDEIVTRLGDESFYAELRG